MSGQADFGVAQIRIRWGRVSCRMPRRTVLVSALLALAALAIGVTALATGDLLLGLDRVVGALVGSETGAVRMVVVDWRMPRALAASLFGAALAAAGAVFQSITRNPLASPDVIGLTSGAYTGGLIAIVVLGGGVLATATGAIVGGAVAAVAVYLLAYRRGTQGFRLIVVGIGVSAMLSAASTYLLMRARIEVAMAASAWGAGTLSDVSWAQLVPAGAGIVVAFVLLAVFSRGLRLLELGDDLAAALGARTELCRLGLIAAAVILTALVTAFTGPIAFVALAAPQIARRLAGAQGMPLMPAALMGAVLLGGSDLIAQHVLSVPIPVGMVTVVIGGAYLFWLLVHEGRRRRWI